jgi:hypothetical protein
MRHIEPAGCRFFERVIEARRGVGATKIVQRVLHEHGDFGFCSNSSPQQ